MNRKHISDLARCLIIAVVLGSLLTLMIPISTVLADSVVTFPDPNLEGAIREAIGKPTGDIYESDLLVLTEFTADDLAIVDLTGLEYCTNLTTLSLEGNQTDNISPLSGLTNLTWLSLYDNQISDISPTENLTALTALGLGYNQISDITPLSGLTSLTELDLDGNQTDNISPLSGLTGLTRLGLDDDQISDISPLSGLTSLTWLGLASNQTDNISPLSGLTSLQWLYLQNNQISDISPLSGLTSLQELLLNGNPIEDILPLAGLTGLTSLALVSNQIDDISPLSSLTNLTLLRLDDNLISDISPLSGLTSLTELGLEDNQVSSLAPLSNLTSLTRLYLSANQISNLSPLSNLINLSRLSLEYNQISNLSPLSGLTNLFEILLDYNQVSDLAPLSGLTGLWGLSLEYDQVSDIQPLVDNPGLASGDVVELRGNPLNADSVNDGIPALEARGVTVTWDGFASQRPNQPVNVQPADASTDVSLTPTLQSSAFSDPDGGDAHTASQWQITTVSGDYSSTVFDSDTDTSHRTSITTPLLDYSTTYYWRVAHQDNHGDWSNWSVETSFTTMVTPDQVPNQPSNVSPANGATGLSLTPTLQSSAFSDPDGGDTHGASQWQISAVSGDYSSPVIDSLTDSVNLVSILVPSGRLSYATTYYWHVRHQDDHAEWSAWSVETSFSTISAPNQTPSG